MKDIARDVGVSTITVSKVLHNHPDISDETRERVLRRIKELNYQPNLSARALVTGRTNTIGLIVPDLVHPFFAEVAKGLAATLRERNYDLLIASSEENGDIEAQAIEQMRARRVDAVVLASVRRGAAVLQTFAERQMKYVLLDRQFNGPKANFVGTDDEMAGALATDHLVAVGCRRIAHIQGPKVSTARGRARGYHQSLQRHGIEVPSEYVVMEEQGEETGDISGYRAMQRLLELEPKPDGVFCYNDPSAMGAMQAIVDAGLRIPQDIALIGCGNVRYAQFLRVPLSSIDQQSGETGSRAAALAIAVVESKKPRAAEQVLLPPTLVARASTARIAAEAH